MGQALSFLPMLLNFGKAFHDTSDWYNQNKKEFNQMSIGDQEDSGASSAKDYAWQKVKDGDFSDAGLTDEWMNVIGGATQGFDMINQHKLLMSRMGSPFAGNSQQLAGRYV